MTNDERIERLEQELARLIAMTNDARIERLEQELARLKEQKRNNTLPDIVGQSKKPLIIIGASALVILFCYFVFVWPTPWETYRVDRVIVKHNRITGSVCQVYVRDGETNTYGDCW